MSMQRKRTYGDQGGYNKASRMVGGRTLTYRPSAPVAGSSRWRSSLGPVSRQAMRTGGWANPSAGAELKFKDAGTTTTLTAGAPNFSSMGATLLLNGLANGSDASTRIGRKVILKSVYVRGTFENTAGATGGAPLRIIIFYDKQANATQPAVTDLLLTDSFLSQNNLSNRDRFTVICDQVTDPISAAGDWSRGFSVYKKLNLETLFNAGSAGTIGDITSGSLYVIFAQGSQILTQNPAVRWISRVRYTDN